MASPYKLDGLSPRAAAGWSKPRGRLRGTQLGLVLFAVGLVVGWLISAHAHRRPTPHWRRPETPTSRLTPPPRGHLGDVLFAQGMSHVAFHEPSMKLALARLFSGGARTVGVVGVEWGTEVHLFAQNGYTVHAFEPMPAFHAAMEKTIRMNALHAAAGRSTRWNVRLHQVAAGADNTGTMDIKYEGRQTKVRRGRLDDFVRDELAVLSVDIQGAELDVLQGARKLLGPDGARSLWIEIFPCNPKVLGVFEILDEHYAIFDFMPWGLPREKSGGGVNETVNLDKHPAWFGDSGGRRPSGFKRYYDWFCRVSHRRFAWMQSDILAVRRDLVTPRMMAKLATMSHDILEEAVEARKGVLVRRAEL